LAACDSSGRKDGDSAVIRGGSPILSIDLLVDQLKVGPLVGNDSVDSGPLDKTVTDHPGAQYSHQDVQLRAGAQVRAVDVRYHRAGGLPQAEVGEGRLLLAGEQYPAQR